MRIPARFAVFAAGTALVASMPVYAQFGGLGAIKKVLEAATKQTPQSQPTSTTTTTSRNTNPSAAQVPPPPSAPTQSHDATSDEVSASAPENPAPLLVGQRAPAQLQTGPMPPALKSGLMKVDECVYFEDGQGQGTTVIEFINYHGLIDTVLISDKSIFKNIGLDDINGKSGVRYLGQDAINYYLEFTFFQDRDVQIVGKSNKQDFANDPFINFDFGGKRTAICYLQANNIG